MDFEFNDQDLRRLCEDMTFTGGFPEGVAKAFRKIVWAMEAADDERDLRVPSGNRYEKLKGRGGEHSIRLNKQWRVVFRLQMKKGVKTIIILRIEDYHK